ncbi:MAG TPA: 2-oxo-4-hydroxy-4-carboxy-5-ureidoimidazoline decarboxylase [Pyrinomonadaceae bacterium]
MDQSLRRLNDLPASDAESEFLKCCGAKKWARAMVAARPFASAGAMFDEADVCFATLSDADWLEAFRAHPKIGEKKAATTQSDTAQAWSAQEQSQTANAATAVMEALAEGNREYEQRFGFIFIVCASGKSAGEMLAMLNQRLANNAGVELQVAAAEQRKITQLRLQKLLAPAG